MCTHTVHSLSSFYFSSLNVSFILSSLGHYTEQGDTPETDNNRHDCNSYSGDHISSWSWSADPGTLLLFVTGLLLLNGRADGERKLVTVDTVR